MEPGGAEGSTIGRLRSQAGNDNPPWQTAAPYSKITKAYRMQWKSLELKDGVRYRLWETPAGDKIAKQLILPKKLRPCVLQIHCYPTAGHLGVNKPLGKKELLGTMQQRCQSFLQNLRPLCFQVRPNKGDQSLTKPVQCWSNLICCCWKLQHSNARSYHWQKCMQLTTLSNLTSDDAGSIATKDKGKPKKSSYPWYNCHLFCIPGLT